MAARTDHPLIGLPGQALREAYPADRLADWLEDSRRRTLRLVEDLGDEQLLVPRLPTINPPLWELGHLAWFAERWALRRHGEPALRPDADALYDSAAVAHDARWALPLPARPQTLAYLGAVLERIFDLLDRGPGQEDTYFALLALFHEDMHGEAFGYTRQALGYAAPRLGSVAAPAAGPCPGDVEVPGGRFLLGALPGEPFVFDNEKWAHPVEVPAFAIARAPVTQSAFAAFADAGGYAARALWSADGWAWRQREAAVAPVYWRREAHAWLRRDFDRWVPLEPDRPMMHVNWYEAEAFCAWAKRRLPTEAEWELAAAGEPAEGRPVRWAVKRPFPWGDEPPAPHLARLDGHGGADVGACPDGDSAFGCRQLFGNVWEWTASDFAPYPGFAVDPYKEYSRPWFGTHKVLRGGCWLTRGRVLRNTWRNFYTPERRDIWAGFRTCAIDP